MRWGDMRSLTYDEYEQQAYTRDFFLTPNDQNAGRPYARTGLSPFDVPEKINVEVTSSDRCLFRFTYSNDEPAQQDAHTIPSNTALSALLGRNTGKILEFRITDALQVFSHGPIDFDDSVANEWSQGLPTHARKTCVRNARVVRAILHKMSEHFRFEIVDLLKAITTEKGRASWE
jgi:hypothetical protein